MLFACEYDDLLPPIRISKFPDNKPSAVSFTFDDGYPSDINLVYPLFVEESLKCTFFVNPGRVTEDRWSQWAFIHDQGFEIGNHGLMHRNLKELGKDELHVEITTAYELIKLHIGEVPFSYAPAFHKSSPLADSVIYSNHFALRDNVHFLNSKAASEFEWKEYGTPDTYSVFELKMQSAIAKQKWYVPCLHGVNDASWRPISLDLLTKIVDYVKRNERNIYVDTFGNISKYRLERENVSISRLDGNVVKLISNLDSTVFNLPLTMVIENFDRYNFYPKHGVKKIKRENGLGLISLMPNSEFILIRK